MVLDGLYVHGYYVDHPAVLLKISLNQDYWGQPSDLTVLLIDVRSEDNVNQTLFIFQRHEDVSLGRARRLSAYHTARYSHLCIRASSSQVTALDDSFDIGTKYLHRMVPGR